MSEAIKSPIAPAIESSTDSSDRLQKIIAQAGIASRRKAEDLISEGLVTVNGKTAKLGDKATLGKDAIKVKGKLIQTALNKVYYLFYKPKNVIAMVNEDEEGRATIKDLISKQIKDRVFTVGRMDFTGEGAILLTNDGELTQKILKSEHIVRRYHVKVDRHPSQEDMARIARGGRIEGRSMQPFHVRVAEHYARNALIEISFEGMGTIDIRKYFENKGFFPERVARVGIGHLSVEKMTPGAFKRVDASSIQALLKQPELAKKQIDKLVHSRTKNYKIPTEDEMARGMDGKRRGRPLKDTDQIEAPKFSRGGRPVVRAGTTAPFATENSEFDLGSRPSTRMPVRDSARADRPTTNRFSKAPGRASSTAARSSRGPSAGSKIRFK